MTAFDECVLGLVLPKVQAWERLNDPEFCGKLKMGQFYELLIKAGYRPDAAQRAANQRGYERLEAGLVM